MALFLGLLALLFPQGLSAQGQSAEAQCGRSGLLRGSDAVPLFDTPENRAVRFTLPVGRVVRVLEAYQGATKVWCRVSPLDSNAQGWVSTDAFTRAELMGAHFGNFHLCLGTRLSPTRPCGSVLSLPVEGLWLRWEYSGLQPGDRVQRVLLVNGERYQLPPVVWEGTREGQQLDDLLTHRPRVERGEWSVWFIVNGQIVEKTSFRMR